MKKNVMNKIRCEMVFSAVPPLFQQKTAYFPYRRKNENGYGN